MDLFAIVKMSIYLLVRITTLRLTGARINVELASNERRVTNTKTCNGLLTEALGFKRRRARRVRLMRGLGTTTYFILRN